MARLVSWPSGLRANFREPLSGPRTVGQAETQSIAGYVQTVASPFGLWRWRFSFPPLKGQMFRRYRGWVTALGGGANATRVPFCDWDGLSLAQMGVADSTAAWKAGQPWSNDKPWSNGKNWASSPPVVKVTTKAAAADTTVWLANTHWGHGLGVGDLIGFFPFHFGLYMVTQVLAAGHYRIWPPLRKELTTDHFATLRPMLAMRMESEDAANAARGATHADNPSITLIEVLDGDLRTYFAD